MNVFILWITLCLLIQSEWTTKKSKNKKKGNQPSDTSVISGADTIVAPGDSRTSSGRDGSRSFGGTSRAG